MTLAGFKSNNHPQQVAKKGAVDEVDDRGTNPDFIASLETRFGTFDLDVAAAAHNAKAPTFYTRDDDGLTQRWFGNVWCNPPYSDCGAWVRKAWTEWCEHKWHETASDMAGVFRFCSKCDREEWSDGTIRPGDSPDRIVMLLPANRVEQGWWQDHIEPYRDRPGSPLRVEFLRGRMRFERPGWTPGAKGDRPPFGCCLVIFGGAS